MEIAFWVVERQQQLAVAAMKAIRPSPPNKLSSELFLGLWSWWLAFVCFEQQRPCCFVRHSIALGFLRMFTPPPRLVLFIAD